MISRGADVLASFLHGGEIAGGEQSVAGLRDDGDPKRFEKLAHAALCTNDVIEGPFFADPIVDLDLIARCEIGARADDPFDTLTRSDTVGSWRGG